MAKSEAEKVFDRNLAATYRIFGWGFHKMIFIRFYVCSVRSGKIGHF